MKKVVDNMVLTVYNNQVGCDKAQVNAAADI